MLIARGYDTLSFRAGRQRASIFTRSAVVDRSKAPALFGQPGLDGRHALIVDLLGFGDSDRSRR
jgi:hypothetical protein